MSSLAKWLAGTLALLVCVALPTWLFDADLLPYPIAVPIRAAAMMLQHPMEGGYPVPQLGGDHPVTGIIVLGGHSSRFFAAAEIAKDEPQAIVVVSGASLEEMDILWQRGVSRPRVLIDPVAATTFENARNVGRIVVTKPGERWLLVTSALHMRRAVGSFCAGGLEVEPYPVFDLNLEPRYAAPVLVREALSLISYLARGRIGDCQGARAVRLNQS